MALEMLPFAQLDPSSVLAAVESQGLRCDGRLLALNSYENRVFRIGLEDAPPVVGKFYRPDRWSDAQLLEEHAFCAELAADGLSVIAPLAHQGQTLHRHGALRFALFPLQGGHAPSLDDDASLRTLGEALGRMHAVGERRTFCHRESLDTETRGWGSLDLLLEGDWIPNALQPQLAVIGEALLDAVERVLAGTAAITRLRLHGDCHAGNVLWRDDRPHFVDFDDACTGPAVQDLWMLLDPAPSRRAAQLRPLLEGYERRRPFDRRELALIEPLRALRLVHFHAWIARRWGDPAFPAAFPQFAERTHWERVLVQWQEQLAILQDD